MDALKSIRVIELSVFAYAPSAGAVLSDWGADVIKVEPPAGDPMRVMVTSGVVPNIKDPNFDGSYPFELFNRGKRGIAIDLATDEGRTALLDLCATADVFLTSYLPPVRRKYRIDVDDIRAVNPSIIFAATTAAGPKGNEAERRGFDGLSFWARGSVQSGVTFEDAREPAPQPPAFGDCLSGIVLAAGIAAALVKRARTGEGSIVHGSLFGTAIWSMQMALAATQVSGLPELPKKDRRKPWNPLVNLYPTADGRWIFLGLVQPDRHWPLLCEAIGRTDLLNDQRFATSVERAQNSAACVDELEKAFLSKSLDEWRQILSLQPFAWDVVRTPAEVIEDDQVLANGLIQQLDYGSVRIPLIASPISMDLQSPVLRRAPQLSEDAMEILAEVGWDEERILNSKISGAIQ